MEFVVVDMQCDDCKKTFTPHKWVANVQIRQRVSPPRTLATFEQVVISNSAHTETIQIKQKDAGLDFHFATKSSCGLCRLRSGALACVREALQAAHFPGRPQLQVHLFHGSCADMQT